MAKRIPHNKLPRPGAPWETQGPARSQGPGPAHGDASGETAHGRPASAAAQDAQGQTPHRLGRRAYLWPRPRPQQHHDAVAPSSGPVLPPKGCEESGRLLLGHGSRGPSRRPTLRGAWALPRAPPAGTASAFEHPRARVGWVGGVRDPQGGKQEPAGYPMWLRVWGSTCVS